jgi:N-acetylglucosaminyldiphosphoundecaprenol N-acetyl-beta-D-mannosaminyltransferase
MTAAALATYSVGADERVGVNVADADALMSKIAERLAAGEGFTLATLNLDHIVKMRRSEAFRRAYIDSTFIVADGKPVAWLGRLAGAPISVAPGSELITPLCALAARCGAPVALYGSDAKTLDTAAARLEARHPGLRIVFRRAPPYGFDPDGAEADRDAAAIGDSGARLCFLALGAPKQERFAARARLVSPNCGFASIGAGLDFTAGKQIRAPVWVRKIAMEWLWRAASDPQRLARRYADCFLILPGLALDSLRRRARRPGAAA